MYKHCALAFVAGVLLAAQPAAPAGEAAPDGVCSFSYSGDGPEHWGDLCSPTNFLCGIGRSQSPIDIPAVLPNSALPALWLFYGPTTAGYEVKDTDHGITVTTDQTKVLRVGDTGSKEVYRLRDFHFHVPSEHKLNSRGFAMEIHFVHFYDRGDPNVVAAVVAVLVVSGARNPTLAKILESRPPANSTVSLDLMPLLPERFGYFHYVGSLTTPPCTECVRWYVLKDPIQASDDQIKSLVRHFPNARPVQDLNRRPVDAKP